jgi:hypothetical protein
VRLPLLNALRKLSIETKLGSKEEDEYAVEDGHELKEDGKDKLCWGGTTEGNIKRYTVEGKAKENEADKSIERKMI